MIRYFAVLLVSLAGFTALDAAPRPNIVHVFADDLGWGGVGFNDDFGHATEIKTPNLDQLASEGLRFTRAYSATVCSPSRAMLMTGLHQGHGDNDRNVRGFLEQDITVADVLKDAGYRTAVVGKWGFGATAGTSTNSNGTLNLRTNPRLNDKPHQLPTNQGFEYFYGYLNHTQAHHYFVDPLWQSATAAPGGVEHSTTGNDAGDGVTNTLSAYSDDLFQSKAEEFIRNHAADVQPFYLQLNYNIPHADFDAIAEVPGWDVPYQGRPAWVGWTQKQRKYAAMVTRMDQHLGQLMAQLDDPDGDPTTNDGISEDTLVIFTSDNGSDPGDGLSRAEWDELKANGPLLGGKRDLYEGGVRVPMVARWPGMIAAGGETDFITDLADFLPTAASLAGVEAPIGIDGVSIAPLLTGSGIQRQRPYHVWEHHNLHGVGPGTKDRHPGYEHRWAIERGGIKLIKLRDLKNGQIKYEMLDLENDPLELSPLSLATDKWEDLKEELEAIAIAEGLDQAAGYHALRRDWVGGEVGELLDYTKWTLADPESTPDAQWLAVVNNRGTDPSVVHLNEDAELLGLEVRGEAAVQTLQIANGARLSGRNEIRIASGGVVNVVNGQLASVRWVDVLDGGKLIGSGRINGQIYNAGEIAPGASPGRFVTDGDLIQLESGMLSIEIGGAAAETGFDQLAVGGQAHLGGNLVVTLIDSFLVKSGDFFPIVVGSKISGEFNHVELPTVPGGPSLALVYRENVLLLVADQLPMPGDLNRDGQLDDEDVQAFMGGWGKTAPAGDMVTYARGDLDYDGDTDRDDWFLLRQAFKAAGRPQLIGVPEPRTTAAISAAGVFLLLKRPARQP